MHEDIEHGVTTVGGHDGLFARRENGKSDSEQKSNTCTGFQCSAT